MLKLQSSDRTPMSFLAAKGEMSKLIREFDWTEHPTGRPESWPQSLRSALGICLNSAFPTAIYWGPELRLFYNDPWSKIPGPRHPDCLGEPAKDVWSDIWHVIEPQFTKVIEKGEGLFVDDQLLPMNRFGFEEETYWSYSFTPIRGEDGTIEGIFNCGQETTAKVLKQRQTTFLLGLTDKLRTCRDADSVMFEACRLLGEHLGAIRIGVREIGEEDGQFGVRLEWAADGIEKMGSRLPWSEIPTIVEQMRAGHVMRVDRLDALTDSEATALSGFGASSVLAVPGHRSGELSAVLFVHRPKAQPWTDEDVATAEQVFTILIQAIDQQRSAQREKTLLNEIDHRARNMLSVSQALIRLTQADDIESFRKLLLERTRALGHTLQVLSESYWEGADLEKLLRQELAPFVDDESASVSIHGPTIIVPSMKAQPISMAFHELVTNAVKYGGLSSNDGRTFISWDLHSDGVVELNWSELNVRPDSHGKQDRSGFGEKLLKITIEDQLGGKLFRQVADGEFRCKIEFSIAQVE